MYEIRFEDHHDHVIAVAITPHDALLAIDRIADETVDQLRANGEGHGQFVLGLVVWDAERSEVVLRSGIRK
jgi:hypothetical protein